MAIKVGLLGCGRIARLMHLDILSTLPGVRVTALAERDPQRLHVAHEHVPHAATFDDYRDLLEQSQVEAVIVCLPPALHAAAARAAFEAGMHVYLEKPLATDLEEGQSVLAAQGRTGTIGTMGFCFRFSPLYQDLQRRLQAGEAGALRAARSVFSAAARDLPDWKKIRQRGGGALLDLASHHIDLARFLFEEEIDRVFATLQSHTTEGDNAALHLRLTSGLTVQSTFSMNALPDHRFEVYGENGRLTADLLRAPQVIHTSPSMEGFRLHRLRRYLDPRFLLHTPDYRAPFAGALRAFVEAARTGRPTAPTLADGYRSLLAIAAAEASAREGRAVAPAALNEHPADAPQPAVRP